MATRRELLVPYYYSLRLVFMIYVLLTSWFMFKNTFYWYLQKQIIYNFKLIYYSKITFKHLLVWIYLNLLDLLIVNICRKRRNLKINYCIKVDDKKVSYLKTNYADMSSGFNPNIIVFQILQTPLRLYVIVRG